MNMLKIGVRVVSLSLLTVILSSCSFISCQPARFKETREISIVPIHNAGLKAQTSNGFINACRSDGPNALLTAHLRCISQQRLDAAEVIAERLPDQTLNLYVKWPQGRRRGNEGCSFEISLPNTSAIELHSSNGALTCTGLAGEALLHTSNGRIEVNKHTGPLTARTSNGMITVRDCTDELDLRTSNGTIHACNVAAPIQAGSSNGRILVELAPDFSGEMSVSTSNGSLDINDLPNVTLLSSGRNHMQFRVGDSTRPSSASTSNGSIHIRPAQ